MRYAAAAAILILAGCSPRAANAPADSATTLDARRQIWAAIQPRAAMRGIDPLFVYALVGLESNFDPHARRGEARGLLQLKPEAWRAASDIPYEPAVWDWRTNLEVGIDRLATLKRALTARGVFSYPRLWATHQYGFDYVAARDFDMSRIDRPDNAIAVRMWRGDVEPVNPPK